MGSNPHINLYTMKSEKALWVLAIVLLITAGALGWLLNTKNQKIVEQTTLINNLTDTVTIFKNKDSLNAARISTIQTARTKDFLAIKSKDITIQDLQQLVKTNENRLGAQGSATVFVSKTTIDTISPTVVSWPDKITSMKIYDDSTKYSSTPIHISTVDEKDYPVYMSKFSLGEWVKGVTIATKDSTRLKLEIINKYDLIIGEEPIPGTGFLGINRKTRPFSEVTNLNPYSQTKTIRTYSVKQLPAAKKRIGLGIQVGYDPIRKQSYIGAGVQYNILNLF